MNTFKYTHTKTARDLFTDMLVHTEALISVLHYFERDRIAFTAPMSPHVRDAIIVVQKTLGNLHSPAHINSHFFSI